MNFSTAVKTCFSKYFNWNGRALRSEYWYFYLFLIIGALVLGFIDGLIGANFILVSIFYLAMILPMFMVTIRRLHDVGKSGWWMLISLIPLVSLILLYWLIIEGDQGDNQFGPHPLGGAGDVSDTFS